MISGRSGDILVFDDVCSNLNLVKQSSLDEYNKHQDSLPEYHTGYRITLNKDMAVTGILDEILKPCLDEYIEQYAFNPENKYSFSDWIIMGWTIPGFGMELHNDHYNDATVHGEKHHQPSLTAIFYLAHDCEGGELNFPDADFTLSPKNGTLIIFPSHMNHQVLTYLSGERIVAQKFVFIGARESK